MKHITDLFCGAGGTSTGILQACADLDQRATLLALNHWTTAINTHTLNHPGVKHLCESLDNVSPARVIPGGHLHLLAASPECTHHSNAAGGRPKNDQSRATAWHICRWAADLTVDNILIENVREFQNWGPLTKNGKPMKRRKGETFKAFINALRSMGFNVEWRVQNAADFGDPTSRLRLIIMARRGKPVTWPAASHGAELEPYRTAREIIDWQVKGQSIFRRKKPLTENTIRRIAAGLRKFSGANAEPFLVMLYGTNNARSVDRPAPTVTANGNHVGLAEPFIINLSHGQSDSMQSVGQPLATITTAKGGEMALCHPFITHLTHHGERKQHSVEEPVPTVTGAHRGELALVEPFVIGQQSCAAPRSADEPLPTIATDGAIALVEPFIVKFHGDHHGRKDGAQRVHETGKPLPTLDTSNRFGLCEPFIVKYYGSGTAVSVNEPLDTVTTRDRFMLVEPKSGRAVAELDILFRMLQPRELASAMSFPKDYQFTGTKGEQVKQIGNAVPVNLARAHAKALLS